MRRAPAATIVLGCLLLASCRTQEYHERLYNDFSKRIHADIRQDLEKLSVQPLATTQPDQAGLPEGFAPWWQKPVQDGGVLPGAKPSKYSLEQLFSQALLHSSQIKVFSDIPLIRETGIREAKGRFDPHAFFETRYAHTDEPVGSTLETARGVDRFWQEETTLEAGLRKKIETGADVSVSQKFVGLESNSVYQFPNPQDQAKLCLSVAQPVLRGAGIAYNTSTIRIARIDSEIGKMEFVRQAESHLMEIARTYWGLYLARGLCLQKRQLVAQSNALVDELKSRKDIDTIKSQLSHSAAIVAKRQAELVRAEMAVRNAQDRLAALVNDPALGGANIELLPADLPSLAELPTNLKEAADAALTNRPEIAQAMLQLKAAAIRAEVQKNELLPQLDLILQMSINGLDHKGLTSAYDDQWNNADFLVGVKLDIPIGNNEAKAKFQRRRLEVRQQVNTISTTIQMVLLEVKVALRDLQSAHREMQYRHQNVTAAKDDIAALEERRKARAGEEGNFTSVYLEMLLDSQDRLSEAEEGLLKSIVEYNVALVNLQRAKGNLLKYEEIAMTRTVDKAAKLPVLELHRAGEPLGASVMTRPQEPSK